MDERYISDGTWFDEGTEAFILGAAFETGQLPRSSHVALFQGVKNGVRDEEVCSFEEFIILGHHSE